MKKRLIYVFVIAAFWLLAPMAHAGTASSADLENSSNWRKVDPSIRGLWQNYQKTGTGGDVKLECFLVVREPPDDGDADFLLSSGFAVQVFAGPTARGHMLLKALPSVVAQPFVRLIKLAKQPGT